MPPTRKRGAAAHEYEGSSPKNRRFSRSKAHRERDATPPLLVRKDKKQAENTTVTAALGKVARGAKPKPQSTTQSWPSGSDPAQPAITGLDSPESDDDIYAIPAVNTQAPRHDGKWYWLMKAEPKTRFENGVYVSFSIDDLRTRTKPEGWDVLIMICVAMAHYRDLGIRAYGARNNLRAMNFGDRAFFYHSNCKEPGIVGIMEIVKEFSEDKSARRPGTPYYDPLSTKESPRWSLVHVEFRKKFAVPIPLRELRELGKPGRPLEGMQMLKQSRLSVSRVSHIEWAVLCRLADAKAANAGLEHEEAK